MIVATSRSASTPLALVELPPRPLGPLDVRVKTRSIGVNPVDWKMREGGPLRLAHRFVGPGGPLVVGVDFSGEIVERGASVRDLAVGQAVVGGTDFSRKQRGSYATEVVVRADQCAPLPSAITFEQAACLPVPGATAHRALVELGRLQERSGARVLVLGASGGVGLVCLQLARAKGADAWGVCSARNVALVERMGARALDYTAGDPLLEASRAGPFDVIVNAVGTATYAGARARALLSPSGVHVLVAVRPHDYPAMTLSSRTTAVLGRPCRANLAPLVALMAKGELEVLVERVFPLAEAEAAHALSRAGKVVGKLLLEPPG